MRIEVTPIKVTSNAGIFNAKVTVENRVVAKGEFGMVAKSNHVL